MNAQEVEQKLQLLPPDMPVMINMSTEGASMTALGVRDMLERYSTPDKIWVRAWANNVDDVPFQRAEKHFFSHFFWMAQRYWHAELVPDSHQYRFACFIGRPTWPRIRMLQDLWQQIGHNCLYSLMDGHLIPIDDSYNLDRRHQWVSKNFDPLEALSKFSSLDGRKVQDQYDPRYNTNLSILEHYPKFDIEIVAETYCHGPAYLPTEKTIRPLLYRRPILIYGPRHFLRCLRDQGFRTWSNWWDESYDDFEGPDRWQAMLEQIKILDLCEHFDAIHDEYQSILDHNANRAREIGMKHQPQ